MATVVGVRLVVQGERAVCSVVNTSMVTTHRPSSAARQVGRFGFCLALILTALQTASGDGSRWLFKALGKDGKADFSAVAVDDGKWQPVELPHRTWDEAQPEDYVYGWYRHHFVPAEEFKGRDLILKLFVIDDADETYCNGVRVGATGVMPPTAKTAYNVDREYIIPADLLRWGQDNVLAVKVYDMIGTGGMVCAPRMGYRVAPGDTWLFKAAGKDEKADHSAVALDDSGWEKVPMPDETWDKRQPQDNVFGWYRLHFTVPANLPRQPLVIDLGLILDCDNTYLNGEWIAKTGDMPPDAFSAAGEPRLYELPPDRINYGGDNVLAIQVFNDYQRGGIWGHPAFLSFADSAPVTRTDTLAHAVRLRHAGYYDEALTLLEKLLAQADTDALRGDVLDELTVVYGALGRDDEALGAFQKLMKELPHESCSREALHAVAEGQEKRGAISEGAVYLGRDAQTVGDWWLRYGNDGFVLSAMGTDCDVYGGPGWCSITDPFGRSLPGQTPRWWRTRTSAREDRGYMNWGSTPTTDRRALYHPITGGRSFAWWDDKGEEHPFDNSGPDLRIEVELPGPGTRLALYMVDPDWCGTWHPRALGVVMTDISGATLAVGDSGKLGGGVWVAFAVRGGTPVALRIVKARSICAVASGVFLDRHWLPAAVPASLTAGTTLTEPLRQLVAQYARIAGASYPSSWPPGPATARLSQDISTFARAGTTSPAERGAAAWMQWQMALLPPPDYAKAEASAGEVAERLMAALGGPATGWSALRQVSAELRAQNRLWAARALDRALASGTPGQARGVAPTEQAQRTAEIAAAWLEVDPPFSGHCFDLALGELRALPWDEKLEAIARLATPYAAQPAFLHFLVRGPIPQGGYPLPQSLAYLSLARRAEEALMELGPDPTRRSELPPNAVAFIAKRSDLCLSDAREAILDRDYPTASREAMRSFRLRQLLPADRQEQEALRLAVLGLSGSGDVQALRTFENTVSEQNVSVDVALSLAEALRRAGDEGLAVRTLERASRRPASDDGMSILRIHEMLARHQMATDDPGGARATFEHLLAAAPQMKSARVAALSRLRAARCIGLLYMQEGNRTAAVPLVDSLATWRNEAPASLTAAFDRDRQALEALLQLTP